MARTVSVILEAKIAGYKAGMQDAEQSTKRLSSTAKDAGKAVEDTGQRASKASEKIAQASRKASAEWEKMQDAAINGSQQWDSTTRDLATGGALLAGAVGLAVREYANFDQAMSGVAATGADAKNNLEALTEAAKSAGADTAFSAVEAANGVEELARAGVTAADTLNGGLVGALDLAAAGQIGVADAAGIASTAMTQFRLSGEQVPHLADLLAAGAGKAMGGVEELGQALKQSGLVASQFGLGIEETVGTLSAFASAGLLGSDAGTSFKSMLLALANPSKKAQTAMDDLGIAAYDAQGQFVGIEGLAGQLQDRLSGLTDAQRNQTLAMIFGTDAIRAASVLYEQGADGIATWTDAVNDSGYAAQQAADLQDNLRGDLEKLGGSLSTLGIEAGEAANGPLRLVTQTVTSLIDALAAAPGAAGGLMVVTAGLGGLALATAGLMKGVSVYANFKTNLAELTELNPRIGQTATVLGKVGKAAGIAGLAVAGAQMLGVALSQFVTVGPGIEQTAAAVERLANGTSGIESLDSTFRSASDPAKELAGGVSDIGSAMAMIDSADTFQGMAYHMEGFVGGLFGMEGQLERVKNQFVGIDQSVAGLSMGQAADTFRQIRDASEEAGVPVEELVALFPQYSAQVQQLAAANGLGELSAGELASAMEMAYDPLTGVQTALSEASTEAAAAGGAFNQAAFDAERLAAAAQEQADVMRDAASAYLAARDAIQGLNDAQRDAAGLFMSEQAATDRYIATLQGLAAQLEENGTSLDEFSEKGRANRGYLRDLASQARDVTDAMLANGAGVDVVNAKMASQRAEFIKTIGSFGILGDAAEGYADDLGLIPNYVETLIAVPGAKVSKDQADQLNAALEGIPDDVRADIITVAHRDGYNAAMAMLNAIDGRTATTYIRTVSIQQSAGRAIPGSGVNVYKAAGGLVRGPGTTTSDSIHAMLSDREYVLRAAAVEKIGLSRLDYINQTGRLPAFANGGFAGDRATSGAHSLSPWSSAPVVHQTTTYNLAGREALMALDTHLRDGSRRDYQQQGVHSG